jgi:hypothetical protein
MAGHILFAHKATADIADANLGKQAGDGIRRGTHGKSLSEHGVRILRGKKLRNGQNRTKTPARIGGKLAAGPAKEPVWPIQPLRTVR